MNFIPNTVEQQKQMLAEAGVSSFEDFFKDIPETVRKKCCVLNVSNALSEIELMKELKEISGMNANASKFSYFLGAGSYNHFIPSVVPHLVGRSEFYTAYTPYQPEISQGMLQAIYEYQTMVCELTGMDVANASMYDGASALAEAALMGTAITERKEIIIPKNLHPHYKAVVRTYASSHNLNIVEIDYLNGTIDLKKLEKIVSNNTACVVVQNPNFFGCIEDLEKIEKIVHSKNAVFIVCIIEPISLGLLKAPGSFNADIVVGEGQVFGNPISFGGPNLGIMAAKMEYVRRIPGRLVGKTTDENGKEGFILTLQAREQHIRREKASSNICSNEALVALTATIYLATMGKTGLKNVAMLSTQKSHYLAEELQKKGLKLAFNSPFFNEFVVKVSDTKALQEKLWLEKIVSGLDLEKFFPELKNHLLLCCTELNSKEEIDKLVSILK